MNIYNVRVVPNGWREYVGLTAYSCRKLGVKLGSIVLTLDVDGSGLVYEPAKEGGYDNAHLYVRCQLTTNKNYDEY